MRPALAQKIALGLFIGMPARNEPWRPSAMTDREPRRGGAGPRFPGAGQDPRRYYPGAALADYLREPRRHYSPGTRAVSVVLELARTSYTTRRHPVAVTHEIRRCDGATFCYQLTEPRRRPS